MWSGLCLSLDFIKRPVVWISSKSLNLGPDSAIRIETTEKECQGKSSPQNQQHIFYLVRRQWLATLPHSRTACGQKGSVPAQDPGIKKKL